MNIRVLTTSIAAACVFTAITPSALALDPVSPQPINLIINKAPRNGTIPDPDPVIIGEFGYNIIFTAKVSATVRKLFFKSITHPNRFTGIDLALRPTEIGSKKFPLKVGKVVKGEIDNYVYEEDNSSDSNGVAFFHEKGNGIYRASSTPFGAPKMVFLKKTDTDKTGVNPEQMASGLSILDWDGKFPTEVINGKKNYQFPYLLFAAPDKKKGKELWLSDGTAAGTKVFMDINQTTTPVMNPKTHKTVQVPNGSNISPISTYFGDLGASSSFGGSAYFSAYNGTGYDVYRVDSIENAAKKQPRVVVNTIFQRLGGFTFSVQPTRLAATPNGVFFTAPYNAVSGPEEIWGYFPGDGSSSVEYYNAAFTAGALAPQNNEFRSGFAFGSYLGYFFSGVQGNDGREPLEAEFDVNGNIVFSRLGNLAAAAASSNPRDITEFGNTAIFVANPGNGEHLYTSNGNPDSAIDLGQFNNIHEITPVWARNSSNDVNGTRTYFVADDNTGTPVLWEFAFDDFESPSTPIQVMTAQNHPVKNPTSLHKLVGNGFNYLFFSCDGVGTEYEFITPAKGAPFPAQHQVWYMGRYLDNNF